LFDSFLKVVKTLTLWIKMKGSHRIRVWLGFELKSFVSWGAGGARWRAWVKTIPRIVFSNEKEVVRFVTRVGVWVREKPVLNGHSKGSK
jgi:hypothetical protein